MPQQVDVNNVVKKLQAKIGDQALTIALLEAQVEALELEMDEASASKTVSGKVDSNGHGEAVSQANLSAISE